MRLRLATLHSRFHSYNASFLVLYCLSSLSMTSITLIFPLALRSSCMLTIYYYFINKPIPGPQNMTFQYDINLLSNWVADNHLALNPLKTKFMFIYHSCTFNFPPLLCISLFLVICITLLVFFICM